MHLYGENSLETTDTENEWKQCARSRGDGSQKICYCNGEVRYGNDRKGWTNKNISSTVVNMPSIECSSHEFGGNDDEEEGGKGEDGGGGDDDDFDDDNENVRRML
jgi:hypothetical protein